MCRKLIIFSVAILAGVILLKKSSLISVWWNDLKSEASAKVTPETRIKQLEAKLGELNAELDKAAQQYTKQKVQHNRFKDTVDKLDAKVAEERKDLETLTAGLKSKNTFVSFHGKELAPDDAQVQLQNKLPQFEADKTLLTHQQELLQEQEKALKAAFDGVQQLSQRKITNELKIAKLKTTLALVNQKKQENKYAIEDNAFGEFDKLAEELETRLQEELLLPEVREQLGLSKQKGPVKDQPSREELLKKADAALQGNVAGQPVSEKKP